MSQLICAVVRSMLVAIILGVGPACADHPLTKVVRDDRGGYIGARAIEIAELNARSIRVELRGRVCLSSCTMYLGATRLCIDPRTSFGFHGPSRNGRPLPPEQFAHWSDIMARHYRPPLRTWFLDDARHQLRGYKRISGAQLVALGYPACP
ncbi:hypothetical protein [Yoonia sp. 2307UL14-13]|uniref:hypothetical protein n=1 Tax=Yoonia sp. 2307UL14-13 TaxID=3126506 RepID=UPI0030A7EBAF